MAADPMYHPSVSFGRYSDYHPLTFFKCDSSENYELNTRLVYAMRCIGEGAESARMFCGIMNLPRHPQNSQSTTTFYCGQQEKPVNTVWQKLFVKPLMKMMEKGTLLLMVAGRSVIFLRRMAC
ncbi:hypothetical protein TNCV_2543131 [Trichonephila clavipes]|nr:hypothetical protein TNCV_2543131 [Trichonephila clavipes]